MRRISILVTILITSFVMTLAGLVASPVATATENESVRVSSTFLFGSPLLTDTQKVAIKKAVTTAGTDVTFVVTGVAGKLPGVSDSEVKLLAKKRGQAVKAYLVKLVVSKSNVTTKVKITRLGIVPKTRIVGSVAAPVVTKTSAAETPIAPATPTVALACAAGGTCLVGDTGPGGGTVYYVDSSAEGFDCGPTLAAICNYLEVAPSGWNTGVEPKKAWATGTISSGNAIANVDGITEDANVYNNELGIGLGYKNSTAIVAQNGVYNASTNNYAAGAARAYAGNSKSDWYLPTTAELNLLCQWNRGVTQNVTSMCTGGAINTGIGASATGLVGSEYWSSSEKDASYVWYQYFGSGGQDPFQKYYALMHVRPVRAFGPTCAAGGICTVGDRGPGGGIVYYVSAANFTSTGSTCNTACKYLEVAPATWQTGTVANDGLYVWSTDTGVATEQDAATLGTESGFTDEKENWKIGKGFSNTNLMKVTSATSDAQAAVLAYAGNSTAGQWFIPSMNELNELCKYARGQTTGVLTVACNSTGTLKTGTANDLGGFVGDYYWSSSEYAANGAWDQYFDSGLQGGATKGFTDYVRPVRAF
jgi:hypothetical protein